MPPSIQKDIVTAWTWNRTFLFMFIILLTNFNWHLFLMPKSNLILDCFLSLVNNICNLVGDSCKHWETLRENQILKVQETLKIDEISSDYGLNQETILKRVIEDVTHIMVHYLSWFYCLLMFLNLFRKIAYHPINKLKDVIYWNLHKKL